MGADAIDEEAAVDATLDGGSEGFGKTLANAVVAENIGEEMDAGFGLFDIFDQFVEGFFVVAEDLDVVAFDGPEVTKLAGELIAGE